MNDLIRGCRKKLVESKKKHYPYIALSRERHRLSAFLALQLGSGIAEGVRDALLVEILFSAYLLYEKSLLKASETVLFDKPYAASYYGRPA